LSFSQRCVLALHLFVKRKRIQELALPSIRLDLYGTYQSGKSTFAQAMFGTKEELASYNTMIIKSVPSSLGKSGAVCISQHETDEAPRVVECTWSSTFSWPEFTAIHESPGWGKRGSPAHPSVETKGDGIVLLLHPNQEESQAEQTLCESLAKAQEQHHKPIFAVLNAIDVRQKRHSLPIDEERERVRGRLASSYGLIVDEVEAISSYHGWLARLVRTYKKRPLPPKVKEEWESCLNRKDEKSSDPVNAVIQRSRIFDVEISFHQFIKTHFLQTWQHQTLSSIHQALEDAGTYLPWLEVALLPASEIQITDTTQ
jgi:hypothetical protein